MSTALTAQALLGPTHPPLRPRKERCLQLAGGFDDVIAETDAGLAHNQLTVTAPRRVVRVHAAEDGRKALSPKQMDAATLLVSGMLGKDVAQALDVADETISRWRRRPAFQALMQSMLAERMEAASMGLCSLAQDCIEELRCLIHGGDDAIRLKAIELLLGTLAKRVTIATDGAFASKRTTARPTRLVA